MTFFTGAHLEFAIYIVIGNYIFAKKQGYESRSLLRGAIVDLSVLLVAFVLPTAKCQGMGRLVYEMLMHILILGIAVAAEKVRCGMPIHSGLLTVFGSITVLSIKNYLLGIMHFLLNEYWTAGLNTGLAVAFYAVVLLLVMRRRKGQDVTIRKNRRYVILASVCITLALSGTSIGTGLDAEDLVYGRYMAFIWCAYTVMELLCVSLVVIFMREEALFDDNIVLNSIIENERHQYEIAKQSVETMNLKYHDLKHIVNMLKESGGVFPEEELKCIEESINSYGSMLKTGNDALDVVIAEKMLLANRQGASITCIADGSALSFMSKADIYVLFGNILENAIEAVLKIPENENRVISLSICRSMGVVRIREKNRRPEGKIILEDGLPTTTKGNGAYHGFGTRSIKTIAEKYGGAIDIEVGEAYYTLNVVLPAEL